MSISKLRSVLDAAECCYEIIQQDKPILSAMDAEGIYLLKNQHQHLSYIVNKVLLDV